MLNGPTLAPPANGINYASWIIVGFIFRTYSSFYSCQSFSFHLLCYLSCWVCLLGRIDERLVEVLEDWGAGETVHASLASWAILTDLHKCFGGFTCRTR
jgi:hypothetical protein